MKKLYRKGKVHPTQPVISDHHALLPARILTLIVALSPEDREVLAYLISCSGTSSSSSGGRRNSPASSGWDHPPSFKCNCFRCYMSYWVRWDSSPNRQVIHEIIDAFEDGLLQRRNMKNKKERRKRRRNESEGVNRFGEGSTRDELSESENGEVSGGGGCGGDGGCEREEEVEKGSVRRLVSFIGESIWNIWSH